MPQYILLLHNDPAGFDRLSPEQIKTETEKYMAWNKKPFVTGSQRLAIDPGRVIRAANGHPLVSDGPYSETKEVLGGYYVIDAANYDEAVKRSLDHPTLEHGGAIEVRQFYEM